MVLAGGVIEKGKVVQSNPRPAVHESRPAACANPLFAGGIPKLKSTGSRPSAPASAPAPPPMRPPMNAAPRAAAPAPAPVRRPAPQPDPVQQPAMPQLRRAPRPEPIERGMPNMSFNEAAPSAPFSASNLRKTGIDMTKQRSAAPPPPPPQMEAPVVRRPLQSRPAERVVPAPRIPTSTGLASANGRWKFPVEDDELPAPPPFEGIKKVYPSGRTYGTTVEPEPVKITRPAPMAAAPPMIKKPVPVASKSGNPADMIDQKLRKLNDELKSAAANEEFESCIEIRGRIKKLKALKDDCEQGFEISPAEINAA